MSLSIGELVGYLRLDDNDFDKGIDGAQKKMEGLADKGKKLGKAAGAALAVATGAALVANLNIDAGRRKLQAQLGLSSDDAREAGKIAGQLYANNFGADLGDVNEAIRTVIQNMDADLNSVDFQPITSQVLALRDTFDQDLNGVTAAAGQLMRTGLAKDAQSALDIVAKGFQGGADKAGDFLDVLNEYSTKFRDAGISGELATGLISQGLKAGARDADKVADAVKELGVRLQDGSSADAIKGLGLDFAKVRQQFAKGGPEASAAVDLILDSLRAIKDPARAGRAGVPARRWPRGGPRQGVPRAGPLQGNPGPRDVRGGGAEGQRHRR